MRTIVFWLRWSWRDLRERWILVTAIALTIALGTGAYAGLTSTSAWRTQSNDASFALLGMYDLRVVLTEGSLAEQGRLAALAGSIPHASWIEHAEERLIMPTQVDASFAGRTILVPGRIVGVDVSAGGPQVNGIAVQAGRGLLPADDGAPVAVVEYNFAKYYDLPADGELRVAGDRALRYVGNGMSPEYFMVTAQTGEIMAEANFAALFVPLGTAQQLYSRVGQVNDLVLTLVPGADPAVIETEFREALGAAIPGMGAAFMLPEDDTTYSALYDDISGDQEFWNVFAVLLLLGASFAAFNLASRLVESQRRQIGIAMALGLPVRLTALRPLLVGAQIALLGVVFGIGVGMVIGRGMGDVIFSMLPLPVWQTPFQVQTFGAAAVAGFLLPFAATLYPVWRAVRVAPVEAIRTGHRAVRGGLSRLAAGVRVPGGSVRQLPLRNVLRAPRRTVLTALGVAAAATVFVAVAGMLDSFSRTIDVGEKEILNGSPDRISVQLDSFYPASVVQTAMDDVTSVERTDTGLRLPASARVGETEIDLSLDLLDMENGMWRPTLIRGDAANQRDGILLSERAAIDLGVEPGDTVTVRHPRRAGSTTYEYVDTDVRVAGTHPHPLRFTAYMDLGQAEIMGLSGLTNMASVEPADGASVADVQAALFGKPGVASVQPAAAGVTTFRDLLEEFIGILGIAEIAALVLALLIAFNSASISMDERARDHATMFAFGLRARTVLALAVAESAVVGLVGTLLGLGGGLLVLRWLAEVLLPSTFPDVSMTVAVSPATVVMAIGLGVLAVGLAPLLTTRRLLRMDVPSTLRVME